MRRVWASVLAVWSTIALVGVLAWSQPAPRPVAQTAPVVVVQRTGGKQISSHVVLLPAGTAAQTTTGSSHVAP